MAEAVSPGLPRVEQSPNRLATWATLIVGVVLVGLAVGFFVRTTMLGSDGARTVVALDSWNDQGILLEVIEQRPEGLEPQDRVVAIDGVNHEAIGTGLLELPPTSRRWAVGDVVTYTVLRDGGTIDFDVTLRGYPFAPKIKEAWATVLATLLILVMAGVAFALRPQVPAARAFMLMGIGAFSAMPWGIGLSAGDLMDGTSFWLYFLSSAIGYPLVMIAFLHFWITFPKVPAPISRRPWAAPALYGIPFVAMGSALVASLVLSPDARTLLLGFGAIATHLIVLIYTTAGLVMAVWRFKATVDPVERRQVRLVVLALGIPLAGGLFLGLIRETFLGEPLLSYHLQAALALPAPLVIVVAVLRYRLFDVDVIVNRAVVYTLLSGVIILGYVLLVGGVGALLQDENNVVLSLIAIGLAAVLFQPLRQRLQREVNRMLYGATSDPYEVLSQLGRRLEETLAPEKLVDGIVATVAGSLHTGYIAVELKGDDEFFVAAERGERLAVSVELPMVYQGEVVGRLVGCVPRRP